MVRKCKYEEQLHGGGKACKEGCVGTCKYRPLPNKSLKKLLIKISVATLLLAGTAIEYKIVVHWMISIFHEIYEINYLSANDSILLILSLFASYGLIWGWVLGFFWICRSKNKNHQKRNFSFYFVKGTLYCLATSVMVIGPILHYIFGFTTGFSISILIGLIIGVSWDIGIYIISKLN